MKQYYIYGILDAKKKRGYIGATSDLNKRIKQHEYLLKRNRHFNRELQRDYNAGNDFVFTEITRFKSDTEIKKILEYLFIDSMGKSGYHVYNYSYTDSYIKLATAAACFLLRWGKIREYMKNGILIKKVA